MTSKRTLTQVQRQKFAEKLMEWGNLTFAGLVIGQIVSGTSPFRISMIFAGLMSMALAYLVAYYLTQEVSDRD